MFSDRIICHSLSFSSPLWCSWWVCAPQRGSGSCCFLFDITGGALMAQKFHRSLTVSFYVIAKPTHWFSSLYTWGAHWCSSRPAQILLTPAAAGGGRWCLGFLYWSPTTGLVLLRQRMWWKRKVTFIMEQIYHRELICTDERKYSMFNLSLAFDGLPVGWRSCSNLCCSLCDIDTVTTVAL